MYTVSFTILILLLFAPSMVICYLAKEENTPLHCFPEERNTLLKFKASFSDPSHRLSSWNNTNTVCCTWKGVQCDEKTRNVVGVDLRNEKFHPNYQDDLYSSASKLHSNALDSSIVKLKRLSFLDLSGNDFKNTSIPAFIGSMNQLQYLNLSNANFSGVIPHHLGNLSRLRILGLSGDRNSLYVDDFMWVSNISLLTHLDMSFVNLTSTKHLLKVLNMLSSVVSLSLHKCGLENANPHNSSFGDELPCFLENMISLRDLDLSSNSFQCTANKIFECIQNNCNLKSLNLGYNSFYGDISNIFRPNSSKCLERKLAKLKLYGNNFYGQLPEEFGQFKNLEYLNLDFNFISGPIPTSISNFSILTAFRLSGNNLNGSIPSYFGNLTNLRYLGLTDNQLTGEIPTSIGELLNLETLSIDGNYFHGIICESHLANLSKLQKCYIGFDLTTLRIRSDWTPPFQLNELWIESCEIEGGQFPKWLQMQKELITLVLSNCSISGAIPDWLWNQNLVNLILSNNHIERSLPKSLCEMVFLQFLNLSRNRLSGNLPECLANLTELIILNLSLNRFSGLIPNSIGGAYSLLCLELNDNNFTGEIPSSLRNCNDLSVLDIGQNKLSGRVPKWIGKYLLSLKDLRLTDNNLYGTIPLELCQLSKLNMLNLANNKLTGNIPRCFGNFSGMVIVHDIPLYIPDFSLKAVTKGAEMDYSFIPIMDLSNNDLVGEIPMELTRLAGLNGLNLSHNHLHGMIPGRIGEMKSLESIDLSNNNLFGNIPVSLSDLDFLGFLNLSHNNFSGKIPTGRHLQTLDDPWRYEGNPGLCGAPLLRKCNTDKEEGTSGVVITQTDEEDKAYSILFYGVVISGFAMGFWVAIGVLVFKRSWRFTYFKFADDIIRRVFGR